MVVKSINKNANNLKKKLGEFKFKANRIRGYVFLSQKWYDSRWFQPSFPHHCTSFPFSFLQVLNFNRKKFEHCQNAVFPALYGFSPSQLLYFQKVKIPLIIIYKWPGFYLKFCPKLPIKILSIFRKVTGWIVVFQTSPRRFLLNLVRYKKQ